jgi:hypothetical protein
MGIQVNRFDALISAVERTASQSHTQEVSAGIAGEHQEYAQSMLVAFSPYSTQYTHVSTGHSHTSIVDGWRSLPVERVGNGASATIANTSEHVNMQRYGTDAKNYPITARSGTGFGSGRLFFWIGPPLKWPVRKAAFRKGGWAWMTMVKHPGYGPWLGSDFVEDMAMASGDTMGNMFVSRGKQEYLRPLRSFFA